MHNKVYYGVVCKVCTEYGCTVCDVSGMSGVHGVYSAYGEYGVCVDGVYVWTVW